MHILFTINMYANLAKIHFRDKDVLILFILIDPLECVLRPLHWYQIYILSVLRPNP